MLRSIRWTLQLWHALLLTLVMCVFGAVLYLRLRHARYQSVDAELRGAAELLAARLKPVFPPPRRDEPPAGKGPFAPRRHDEDQPPGRPPPWERDVQPQHGRPPPATMPAGPQPWQPRERRPLTDAERARFEEEMSRHLVVPDNMAQRYDSADPGGLYFAVWRPGGELLRSSRSEGEIPAAATRPAGSAPPEPLFRSRGVFREAIVPGPFGTQVLAGRSIEKERAELRQLLWLLGGAGGGAMLLGLAGGWVLSRRAVRPIQAITSTARSISATNLSRRISVPGTESELGEMAGVLNDMFARLEEAFERQVRFTADASHELRTPLSIIYSHAELALSRQRTAEEYRQTIEKCLRACQRMRSLVDSLLTLARADAGRLQLKVETVDLARVAEECVELARPLAQVRRVRFTTDLRPAAVSADPFRIAQAITNLLTNAINYNRDDGAVTVTVGREDSWAVISVADTGPGISPEDQKHLFERFYRVDKARSREMGGSGLGLAICRSIVEAHGGNVSCASVPGEGSTFTIRLPAGAAACS